MAGEISPGLGGMRPRKIMELLKYNNMGIKNIINIHEHADYIVGGKANKFLTFKVSEEKKSNKIDNIIDEGKIVLNNT